MMPKRKDKQRINSLIKEICTIADAQVEVKDGRTLSVNLPNYLFDQHKIFDKMSIPPKQPIGAKEGVGVLPQQINHTRYLYVKFNYAGLPFFFSDIAPVTIERSEKEAPPAEWEFKRKYLSSVNKNFLRGVKVEYILHGVHPIKDRPTTQTDNPLES